jgi:hypothetical protein
MPGTKRKRGNDQQRPKPKKALPSTSSPSNVLASLGKLSLRDNADKSKMATRRLISEGNYSRTGDAKAGTSVVTRGTSVAEHARTKAQKKMRYLHKEKVIAARRHQQDGGEEHRSGSPRQSHRPIVPPPPRRMKRQGSAKLSPSSALAESLRKLKLKNAAKMEQRRAISEGSDGARVVVSEGTNQMQRIVDDNQIVQRKMYYETQKKRRAKKLKKP